MWATKPHDHRLAQRWALLGVMALALGVRLWGLARESLWFDEAYSVAFGRQPLAAFSLINLQGMPFADRNLYDLFLHFWLLIAGGGVIAAVVALGAGFVLMRRGRKPQTGSPAAS